MIPLHLAFLLVAAQAPAVTTQSHVVVVPRGSATTVFGAQDSQGTLFVAPQSAGESPSRLEGQAIARFDSQAPEGRAWIGVEIASAEGGEGGLEVANVTDDSPAARAGIQPGDRLLALDGEPLADFQDLRNRLDRRRSGERVQLTLRHKTMVRLDERGAGDAGGPRLGVRLREDSPGAGLEVSSVERGWPAARAGVRPGDRIVTAGGQALGSFEQLQEALSGAQPGSEIELILERRFPLTLGTFPGESSQPSGQGRFQLEQPEAPQQQGDSQGQAAPRLDRPPRIFGLPEGQDGRGGIWIRPTPTPRAVPQTLQEELRTLREELRALREELRALRSELDELRRSRER